MAGLKQVYKVFDGEEHVGYFNIDYTASGEGLTVDLFKPCKSFTLLFDEKGHVSSKRTEGWIEDRVIPKTRIGIEKNLQAMGLLEYDELAILRFTKARHIRDNCWIDFEKQVE